MDVENSLEKIQNEKLWLLWAMRDKGGKKAKVPFDTDGKATGTDEKYASSWVTYKEASQAKDKKKADGVGFVIPKGMVFIDVDHISENKELFDAVSSLVPSYAEKSPSGNGAHILAFCDIERIPQTDRESGGKKLDEKYYVKNSKLGLEIYFGGLTNRFATFTGERLNGYDVVDSTESVIAFLNKYMLKGTKEPSVRKDNSADKTSLEERASTLIEQLKSQRNSKKFKALFFDGDISSYGSQSEADLALSTIIAFKAKGDEELIDEVFRHSALYREKWEREDYRRSTIRKAISYASSSSDNPLPFFIVSDDKGNLFVSARLLADYFREHVKYGLFRNNAREDIMVYVYHGGRYEYADDNVLKGIMKRMIASYDPTYISFSAIKSAIEHLKTDLEYRRLDELDSDESIINFSNGLLDIANPDGFYLREHDESVLSTIQLPSVWRGKETATPVFDSYLDTLCNGDKEVENLILEFMGVALSNIKGWRLKKALFLVGDGDTGKSQLKSLCEKLLGKGNYVGIDLSEIEARFGTGVIYSKRLAGSSDMSFLSVSELKTFKKLTGGDSVFAEFKGMQGFEYTFSGLLWFCMNRLPKFGGDDGEWVYNRIMVVECPNVIPKNKQDKRLLDKLYSERDGIIYKAIMALRSVIRNGYRFTEPEKVTRARKDYAETNSTVITFFSECMERRDVSKALSSSPSAAGRIYRVYQAWCRENNNGFARTQKEFRDTLSSYLGVPYKTLTTRINGITRYRDYALNKEALSLFEKAYGYDDVDVLT